MPSVTILDIPASEAKSVSRGKIVTNFNALKAAVEASMSLAGDAYIIAPRPTNNPVANGTLLLAAYVAAKALTPNGAAITTTNRANLLVLPGVYDFEATPLVMDMEGVNLIGLAGNFGAVAFKSDVECEINVGSVLVKGISFQVRGDEDSVGLQIAADLSDIEFDSVQVFIPELGSFQIRIGAGDTDESAVVLRNCDISRGAMDGSVYGTVAFDDVSIGQYKPGFGKFVDLWARHGFRVRPDDSTSNAADITKIAAGFATLNFGSILAGASVDRTLVVSGLIAGNNRSMCSVGHASAPPAGAVFQAWVSDTDQVTIRATNVTGATINPASADYSVIVFRVTAPSEE